MFGNRAKSGLDTYLNSGSTYGYDQLNRLVSATVNGTVTAYSYDRYGNRVSQTPGPTVQPLTGNNQLQGFSYDAAGNLLQDAAGNQYQYDAEGNVLAVTNRGIAWTYDAFNQRVRVEENGVNYEFDYDSSGRRVSVWQGNTRVQGQYYAGGMGVGYYANGMTRFQHKDWLGTERIRTRPDGSVEGRFYQGAFGDNLQIQGADTDGAHFAGQDADVFNGTSHAQFRQLSADPTSNRLNGYSYDYAGNLLNDGLHSYQYDPEGNVTTVDGGQTATYYYDGFNQRIRVDANGTSTAYAFNLEGQRNSTWNALSNGTALVMTATTFFNGQPLAYWKNDGGNGLTYYQEQDAVGSERIRTTASAGLLAAFANEPFGDNFQSSGTDEDQSHFSELDHDSGSDTSHAQFRQLSTTEGRWMSPDPYSGSYDLSNPQSMNRYAYVLNNPLGASDPSGQAVVVVPPSIGVGVSIAVDVGTAVVGGAILYGIEEGLKDLYDAFFGKPPFHGSTNPRAEARGGSTADPWSETIGGVHLGYPKSMPALGGISGIAGALGIPLDQGCEFGACGATSALSAGGTGGNKSIESLWDRIQEHLGYIADEPEAQAVNHWWNEIHAAASRINERAMKVTQKRSEGAYERYLKRFGIAASDLEDLLPSPIIVVNPCLTTVRCKPYVQPGG